MTWIVDIEEDMQIMGIRRWRKQNGRESLRRLKPILGCKGKGKVIPLQA